jgi:hypothetical protein
MIGLSDVPTDQLETALLQAGCPICHLRRERETRFIANVLGDWVVAAMVRATFIDALGYCPTHAWLQQSIEWNYQRDGSTTADMYRYVLRWNLDGLEMFTWLSRRLLKLQQMFPFAQLFQHHNGSREKPSDLRHTSARRVYLPAGLVVRGQCPICETGKQSERARLRGLMERLESSEFQAKYRASPGLCLPHLHQAIDTVNDLQLRHILISTELERLTVKAGQLSHPLEQSELNDTPTQVSTWQRLTCSQAITQLVGNRPAIRPVAAAHAARSLDEALTLDTCPLCALTVAARQDDLEQRLTDQTIEEPLCHHHAWQLYDLAIAQANESELAAIVFGWMNSAIAQLRASEANSSRNTDRPNGRWRGRIKQRLTRGQIKMDRSDARPDCPICRSEAMVQEQHLAHFLKRLEDADLRQRYATSCGLCLPHLRAALQTAARREDRLFLAMTARDRVADLVHLVEEYERKHIWNYRDEPKLAQEQNSWIRAVAFEVGE